MKKISKIILSTTFITALLVGCGGGSSTNPQDITEKFKGVWIVDSNNSDIKGCLNDLEDGDSIYFTLNIDQKIVVDTKKYSELNCDPKTLEKSFTKTYDYTIETKNFAKTKSGTTIYGLDLTLTSVSYHKGTYNGNNLSTGKKYYSLIGKNDKNLLIIEGSKDKKERDNFIENNISKISDSDDIVIKLIKK